MSQLILMRHGESQWNSLNQFTGWVDVPLSPKGIQQAIEEGKKIREIPVDIIFTSSLIRSQMTAMLAMSVHSSGKVPMIIHEGKLGEWAKIHNEQAEKNCIPVYAAWELNERMYGELQGLNKTETREKYGEDQVQLWRRSYTTSPPNGESLQMTAERTLPYFKEKILPRLTEGKNVLVSAHGNSIRSIVMFLDRLSEEEVVNLEIPLAEPIVYEFQNERLVRAK